MAPENLTEKKYQKKNILICATEENRYHPDTALELILDRKKTFRSLFVIISPSENMEERL